MTINLVSSAILLAASASLLAAESAIPERAPASKYDKLKNEAPFAVASEAPPPADIGPKWSDGLFLSGVYKIDGPAGKIDVVNIINRNEPGTLITLEGNQVNDQGFQLVTLNYNDDGLKTKATIKKGNDFADIGRDQASYAAMAQPPMPPGGVRPPGKGGIVLPSTNGMIRPPTTPGVSQIPRPSVVPPPQTRPAVAPGLPAPAPQQGQQPQNERRRIRVIGNGGK